MGCGCEDGGVVGFASERLDGSEIGESADEVKLDVCLEGEEDDAVERGDGAGEGGELEIVPETELGVPVCDDLGALLLSIDMGLFRGWRKDGRYCWRRLGLRELLCVVIGCGLWRTSGLCVGGLGWRELLRRPWDDRSVGSSFEAIGLRSVRGRLRGRRRRGYYAWNKSLCEWVKLGRRSVWLRQGFRRWLRFGSRELSCLRRLWILLIGG